MDPQGVLPLDSNNERSPPMSAGLRILSVAAAVACMVFAGSASAATDSFSGSVMNGSCDGTRNVSVSGPSRIEMAVASTAQNNTTVLAEVIAGNGKVFGVSSYVQYAASSGRTYSV